MRAINASVMRKINKKLILDRIRKRPISRAELAEETQLTRASITQIVDELIEEGLVEETSVVGRMRLGRRSTQLGIAADGAIAVGVCLYHSCCQVGWTNLHGSVQSSAWIERGVLSPTEAMDVIAQHIRMQDEKGARCIGVGLCLPGPVNAAEGRVLQPVGFEAWHNQPLSDLLGARTGLPVYLESSVNARALEEKFFGDAGEHFALIRLGTGISASVIADGRVYHGAQYRAADLGALAVGADPDQGRIAEKLLLEGSPWTALRDLIAHRDAPKAAEPMERFIKYLALGAVNISRAFDVKKFIIACDESLKCTDWLEQVRARIGAYDEKGWDIRFGNQSDPVRMAASVAFENFYSPEIND